MNNPILSPAEARRALTAVVRDGPDLTGAACTPFPGLHDDQGHAETDSDHAARVIAAQTVCVTCPVLDRCHAVAAALPPIHRSGVWAGVAYRHNRAPDPDANTAAEQVQP